MKAGDQYPIDFDGVNQITSSQPQDTNDISYNLDNYNEEIESSINTNLFYRASDLIKMETESIPTLFDTIIPQNGLIAIVGASETGKSSFVRQLALNIVLGTDFIGLKNNAKYNSAIIVSTEDDRNSISYLLAQNKKTMCYEDNDISGLKYLFYSDKIVEELENTLEVEPVDAIIIDSPIDIFDGKDFNDSVQVRRFLNQFKAISQNYNCLIIFIHHTGKRTENNAPSKNNILGSQAFEAVMRLVLELRFDNYSPDLRHLCIVKSNYLPPRAKQEALILEIDENLVFHYTAKTIPTCELTITKKNSSIRKPQDYPDNYHIEFLEDIFSKEKNTFNQAELNILVQEHYKRSEKPAREFIRYFEKNNWIINTSGKSSIKAYKLSNNIRQS